MTSRSLWSTVLIIALSLVLIAPPCVSASQIGGGPYTGAIAGAAVGAATVIIVVVYYSTKKRSITGCVGSAGGGMSLTNEKDKRVYVLSGNTVGIKPGDRMKLQGKKVKSAGLEKTVGWAATKVAKDYGVCQPYPSDASPTSTCIVHSGGELDHTSTVSSNFPAAEPAEFPKQDNEFRDVVKSQVESLSVPFCMEVRLCADQQLITSLAG